MTTYDDDDDEEYDDDDDKDDDQQSQGDKVSKQNKPKTLCMELTIWKSTELFNKILRALSPTMRQLMFCTLVQVPSHCGEHDLLERSCNGVDCIRVALVRPSS